MKKYLYEDLFLLEDKHWWHISKRRIVHKLIEKYNTKENPKILDIGCGTGKNMEDLQNLGSIYGLDSSPEALRFCKKRGLNNLILGSAEKTKLKNNFFDIITILDVLEHTDDKKTLKEVHRILRDDGLIIITVPAFSWLWSNWDIVLHHKRRYTKKNLTGVFKKEGLQIIKISYMYSFLVLPVLIIRALKSLFLKKSYSSDFKLSSPFLNLIMNKITNIESFFIMLTSIPIGTSIIVVAKKNDY